MNRKVTVVGGAGNVGATVARAIAVKELADVVIVDIADTKAAGIAQIAMATYLLNAEVMTHHGKSNRC